MLDMFKNPGAAFSPEKKAPAAIPTARKMLKIHKNIWTHTQKHLDKYTRTFGQIHKNIWTNTQEHLETYTKSFGNTPQMAPNEKVVVHGKVEFTL